MQQKLDNNIFHEQSVKDERIKADIKFVDYVTENIVKAKTKTAVKQASLKEILSIIDENARYREKLRN